MAARLGIAATGSRSTARRARHHRYQLGARPDGAGAPEPAGSNGPSRPASGSTQPGFVALRGITQTPTGPASRMTRRRSLAAHVDLDPCGGSPTRARDLDARPRLLDVTSDDHNGTRPSPADSGTVAAAANSLDPAASLERRRVARWLGGGPGFAPWRSNRDDGRAGDLKGA